MKTLLLIISLCYSFLAFSQISPFQSQPDINWKKIESENFNVIFPDYLEAKGRESISLLEHYRKEVTGPYQILPKKLNLVLRPEVHIPNGFVTLAPRRSEWYNFSSITPIVGSLEWLQSLAIHEYRHVVQYEYLNQGYVNWGYKLFGESLTAILIHIIMPTWYFEGDAVYTETTLSDGGRGRSPRFNERLRAILSSGEIPKYDDLLAGSYTENLPNLYVYGYFLITEGYRRFGKNFWKNVAYYSTYRPWNFYAFYNGFKVHSGISFEQFFHETFDKLKDEWNLNQKPLKNKIYSTSQYPIITKTNKYYLKKDLNTYWGLYKNDKLLKELNISPSISHIDVNDTHMIYVQQRPHRRYLFQGSSDLFLLNHNSGKQTRITQSQRYYHPRLSPSGKKLGAIHFSDQKGFKLHILDLDGKLVTEIRPEETSHNIAEFSFINEQELVALILDEEGKKYFAKVNLESKKFFQITKSTRNNIYALNHWDNKVYFEGDFQGVVSIFEMDLINNKLSLCHRPELGAHHPFRFDNQLYFSNTHANGSSIKNIDLYCNEIKADTIYNSDLYLSRGASDNFHSQKPAPLNRRDLNFIKKDAEKYIDHQELLKPHSWSFFSDRGFELNGTSQNYLGTKSLNLYAGSSYASGASYFGGTFLYSKYYPIFGITLDRAEREEELDSSITTRWKEYTGLISMTLPYFHTQNLFNGYHALGFSKGLIITTENEYTSKNKLNNEHYQIDGITLNSSILKAKTLQEPKPSLGYTFSASYFNLSVDERDSNNYLAQYNLDTFLPSLFRNHIIGLNYFGEFRPNDKDQYRLQQNYTGFIEYQFSRGHGYSFTPMLQKYELEYTLPIIYPQAGALDWIYLTRIYSTLFFDMTDYKDQENIRSLSSFGAEIYFETNTLRKLPLTYGIRFLTKHGQEESHVEIFLASLL